MTYLKSLLTIKPWIWFSIFVLYSIVGNAFPIYVPIFLFLLTSFFTYWTLGVGTELHGKLRDNSMLRLKRFKFQIGFVIVIILIALSLVIIGQKILAEFINDNSWILWIIIPIHFLTMFFMFHTIYFLSKCISVLRNERGNVHWYMLGFWFFPIGIWIIQPRIIKLINKED